ncbi:MAG: ParB/RepB/Spo0J family partition protein [Deltaproteobacteria bacterium]|nr:ParB/RepB/Spo0J family partition protein [Candidatus Anaeroferrophillacea bacterium]
MIELSCQPEPISLTEVDFADRTYPFSWGAPPAGLVASVRRLGVMVPPLLAPGTKGWIIVSGRRRLLAAGEVGLAEVAVGRLTTADPAELLPRVFWENAGSRSFNPVEAADILTVLEPLLPAAELARDVVPALGLASGARTLARCRALHDFPEVLRDLAAGGRVDGETVDRLREWSPAAIAAAARRATELPLNRNQLRELVELVDGVARRQGEPPAVVLTRLKDAAGNGAKDGDGPGRDTPAAVRDRLRGWYYPHLRAAEERFDRRRAALGLPAGVCLQPAPGFEGGFLELRCRVAGGDAWRTQRDWLAALAPETVDELLDV